MPDEWGYFNALSLLGECLMVQTKLAEAEPSLIQGAEGLMQRANLVPESIRAVLLNEAAVWASELRTYSDQLSVKQPKTDTDEQIHSSD